MFKKVMLALLLAPLVISAQVTETSKRVTGAGKTYDKALQNALVEAVSQTSGVDVAGVQQSINKTFEANIDAKSSNYGDLKANVKLAKEVESSIRIATHGVINAYDVIDSKQIDSMWQITVMVKIGQYQSVDARSKLNLYSIALMPFHFMPESINGLIALGQLKPMIQDALQNQFVQSGKFNVVSRSAKDFSAYEDEMSVLKSMHANSKEQARIKQLVGADFVLVGDIASFDFYQTKKDFYGENFKTWQVGLVINYRVIETATMTIKWSNKVQISLPSAEVARKINTQTQTAIQIAQGLFSQVAQEIADQVVGMIYPLTVLMVQDGQIYLNQGGERVRIGQKFVVHAKAETVVDPSTGESISIQGREVATLEIISVTSKYAIAKVLSGEAHAVIKGLQVYPVK